LDVSDLVPGSVNVFEMIADRLEVLNPSTEIRE